MVRSGRRISGGELGKCCCCRCCWYRRHQAAAAELPVLLNCLSVIVLTAIKCIYSSGCMKVLQTLLIDSKGLLAPPVTTTIIQLSGTL